MGGEPLRRQAGHLFEFARLLEQMSRSRHDRQPLHGGSQLFERVFVQSKDGWVVAAHDQQRWRLD